MIFRIAFVLGISFCASCSDSYLDTKEYVFYKVDNPYLYEGNDGSQIEVYARHGSNEETQIVKNEVHLHKEIHGNRSYVTKSVYSIEGDWIVRKVDDSSGKIIPRMVRPEGTEWSVEGVVYARGGGPSSENFDCRTSGIKKREFNQEVVEILKVTCVLYQGNGKTVQVKKEYGRGIGLLIKTTKSIDNNREVALHERTLVRF